MKSADVLDEVPPRRGSRARAGRDATDLVKLTVGIPTFNRAELLRETIESVLAQTFTDFRLIVSDNASDEDTREVVQTFPDERIEYVRSERNLGAIGNLNRLIELTETQFLMLLPDDDLLYPEHLSSTVEALERFATAGLAHTAFDFIDSTARVIRSFDPLPSRWPMTLNRRDLALEQLMVINMAPCFSSVAYRTEAIVGAGGSREEDGPFGDRKLWMRMAVDWDFAYVATPLAGFRLHSERLSNEVLAEDATTSDDADVVQMYAQVHFKGRMEFLDEGHLEPQRTKRLRALAKLQFLIEAPASDFRGPRWRAALRALCARIQQFWRAPHCGASSSPNSEDDDCGLPCAKPTVGAGASALATSDPQVHQPAARSSSCERHARR